MATPLISVILPCHSMGKFIRQALESVAHQTYTNWELIAVDDCGPEDGTQKALLDFKESHPSNRVEYIRNQINVGCGESRNIGMNAACSDFYAFLDPDDFWNELYLDHAVRGIEGHDLCFCRCRSVDEEGRDLGPHLGKRMNGLVSNFPDSLLRENFLVPSSTFVRRSIRDKIGGFTSDRAVMYAADWDFYLRCIAGKAKFAFHMGEDCFYRRHAAAATANYLKITKECAQILRNNYKATKGQTKLKLQETLYVHLCRLAYMKISFRDWSGLRDAFVASSIRPFQMKPWVQVLLGLKNNW
jgi:glycosyltransferase involved in cell wall biosynthesis